MHLAQKHEYAERFFRNRSPKGQVRSAAAGSATDPSANQIRNDS